MINQLLAGIVAAIGWPAGALLYKWTTEEWDWCYKHLKPFRKLSLPIAAVLGAILGWYFSDVLAIIILSAGLIFGSFAAVRTKNIWRVAGLAFVIQLSIFAIIFWAKTF